MKLSSLVPKYLYAHSLELPLWWSARSHLWTMQTNVNFPVKLSFFNWEKYLKLHLCDALGTSKLYVSSHPWTIQTNLSLLMQLFWLVSKCLYAHSPESPQSYESWCQARLWSAFRWHNIHKTWTFQFLLVSIGFSLSKSIKLILQYIPTSCVVTLRGYICAWYM